MVRFIAMEKPDPLDFETPIYQLWFRDTTYDGRSGGRYSTPGVPETPYTMGSATNDIIAARHFLATAKSKPNQDAFVKVVWELDRAAYLTACELYELARLRAKHPNA